MLQSGKQVCYCYLGGAKVATKRANKLEGNLLSICVEVYISIPASLLDRSRSLYEQIVVGCTVEVQVSQGYHEVIGLDCGSSSELPSSSDSTNPDSLVSFMVPCSLQK